VPVIIQTIWHDIHEKSDDVIARAAIYQWPYKLLMLQTISVLPTQLNVLVLNYYVTLVMSGEIVCCWIWSGDEVVKLSSEITWTSETLEVCILVKSDGNIFYGASKYFSIQNFFRVRLWGKYLNGSKEQFKNTSFGVSQFKGTCWQHLTETSEGGFRNCFLHAVSLTSVCIKMRQVWRNVLIIYFISPKVFGSDFI
jgi:hypothetical protein